MVTLSFSAHSTGSLAFVTSTASGSAEAACTSPVRAADRAHAAAISTAHLPLPREGLGVAALAVARE